MDGYEARQLSDNVSVSPQINAGDVQKIKETGFKAIVCNRPDGEVFGQPAYGDVQKAAADAGLEFRFLPVISGRMTLDDVKVFRNALNELQGPVLAYCRTGTRCATLWAFSQADQLSIPDILTATKAAGYDLSGLADQLGQVGKHATA